MIDLPNDHLTDTLLLEEINLLTGVIIAATMSIGRLSVREIDEVLGTVRDVDDVPSGAEANCRHDFSR